MLPIVSRFWPVMQGGELVRRSQRFVLWHVKQVRERTLDLYHNVDTFGPAPDDIHNGKWPYAYDSAPWSAPLRILQHLHLDFPRFTFIDMGSGKGRVVLAASTLPFTRVVGVEFSAPLCRIAKRNLETCRYLRRRAEDIRIVEADATAFAVPDTPCIYYFYNPFSFELLDLVISNIKHSYYRLPRELYLIFMGMSTVMSGIGRISSLKLLKSFDLPIGLGNKRSVFIFSIADD